jgi:DNA-directed RNA polymerase subunit omega
MARITIEDCTEKVPNRFHLVQMAAIRAKQLKLGANTLVAAEDNKAVVIALREIAAGRVHPDYPEEIDESGNVVDAGDSSKSSES